MNTIMPAIITQIYDNFISAARLHMQDYLTKEQFLTFREAFKKRAREKRITSEDIILYNIVRGLPVERGYTQIKNSNKLQNGMSPYTTLELSIVKTRSQIIHYLDETNERFGNFLGTLPDKRLTADAKMSAVQKASQRSAFAAHVYEVLSK